MLCSSVCTLYTGPHLDNYRAKLKKEIIAGCAIDSDYLRNPFSYTYDKACNATASDFIDYVCQEENNDEFKQENIQKLYECMSKYENVFNTEKTKKLDNLERKYLDRSIRELDTFKKEVNTFKEVLEKEPYAKKIHVNKYKEECIDREIKRDLESNGLTNPFLYKDKICYEVSKKFLDMNFNLTQTEIQMINNCIGKYKAIHQSVNEPHLDDDKNSNISYTNIETITNNLSAFIHRLRNVFKRIAFKERKQELYEFEKEFALYKVAVKADQQAKK
jgi:hypothetical protein